MHTPSRFTRLTVALVLATGIAACGTTADPATTTTPSPATTDSPATTAAPTTTAAPETTIPPATTVPPETTVPLPEFPPERTDLAHGGPTWAVVLAGGSTPEDPAIVAAATAAQDAGYTSAWTDCDEGAAEALGMSGGTITLSVYFETEVDAEAAAAAFAARGIDGVVAEVRTFCLD